MEPPCNGERIVRCVLKQQENNRMLSPMSDAGSPASLERRLSVGAVGRGNYRYCSPIEYHRTALHQSMDTALSEMQAAASAGTVEKKGKVRNRSRSLSMSFCQDSSCGFVEDCHTTPLMCFNDDVEPNRGQSAAKKFTNDGMRRNPLRQIGNLLGCFASTAPRPVVCNQGIKKSSWEKKTPSLALLELSQRQQSALALKQDTIELLEWKLEQLQTQNSASTLANSDVDFSQGQLVSSDLLSDSTWGGEERGKCPQIQLPFLTGLRKSPKVHESLASHVEELGAVPQLFETVAMKARVAVRYFCKVFMKQMEVSGYSVWRTLAEIEPNAKIMNKEHSAFLLESRLNKALYHSFENDSFDDTGLTRIIDPEKRCTVRFADFQRLRPVEAVNAVNSQHRDYDADFAAFSESKMREMWFLFPWNVVFKDAEERSSFTGAFLDAAKCVWLLHRLAYSLHPHVTILRVGKGMDAISQYVEQVAPVDEGCKRCNGPKVEFMSMPGFQIGKKIIKCQVYRHLQCSTSKRNWH